MIGCLKIGNLKVRIPIIQGGMGVGISLSGLASAVANEGGLGVISCAGLGLLYPKRKLWEKRITPKRCMDQNTSFWNISVV